SCPYDENIVNHCMALINPCLTSEWGFGGLWPPKNPIRRGGEGRQSHPRTPPDDGIWSAQPPRPPHSCCNTMNYAISFFMQHSVMQSSFLQFRHITFERRDEAHELIDKAGSRSSELGRAWLWYTIPAPAFCFIIRQAHDQSPPVTCVDRRPRTGLSRFPRAL